MISVIIPVYNVAPYLEKCFESVSKQTYRDIEIIIIDDGSTDESGKICDCYAKLDARVKVIHKENFGLSSARNVGMGKAKGDWTFFIDSDDWIHPDTLIKLYEFAILNKCDVVQCNHYYAYDNYLLYRISNKKETKLNVLDRIEAMHQLIINERIKNFAWGKLYKTDLIRDLKFPEGKYFEDSFWQHKSIHKIKKYGIIDTPLYYYRQRNNSISGSPSNKIKDLMDGYKERLEFISIYYPELAPLITKKCDDLNKLINGSFTKKNPLFKDIVNSIVSRLSNIGKYKKIRI